eukprot:1392855-Prymnesium_polylepis.2
MAPLPSSRISGSTCTSPLNLAWRGLRPQLLLVEGAPAGQQEVTHSRRRLGDKPLDGAHDRMLLRPVIVRWPHDTPAQGGGSTPPRVRRRCGGRRAPA